MTEREAALTRIKKLLNMAEHAGANEHEALVAAKQAESLMRKYNVDYAEAIATEIKTGAGITMGEYVATAKDNGTATKETPLWAQYISVRVGELFDAPVRRVQIKTDKGWEEAIRFHGYEHDVAVAVWTFDLLVKTVNRVCKEYRKHPHYLANGRTVMNAYRLGVTHSITATLNDMIAAKVAEQATTGTALVWVKRDAVAKKFGEFTYKTAAKPATVKDITAYHAGRVEGAKIQIQSAINGTKIAGQLA